MKTLLILSLSLLSLSSHATRWYVDITASGANNGTSWDDAFTDLQLGIAATIPGDEIWVAQGVYKPTTGTLRNIPFSLPNGVAIYGGFAGTEANLSERDIDGNATVLSGNIGQQGSATDNTYQVVYASNVNIATRLDGFTVVSGYNSTTGGSGAGFYNSDGSPTVANCTFTANHSHQEGGAIHQSGGTLTLLNCDITMNTVNSRGAGVSMYEGTLNIIGCNISNNESESNAGAIFLDWGICNIDRTVISGNRAMNQATIQMDNGATLYMYNSLIVGNYTNTLPVTFVNGINGIEHRIINCTIAHNRAVNASTDAMDLNGESIVTNCIIYGNTGVDQINSLDEDEVSNSIVQGGYPGGTGILNVNPQFAQPALLLQAPFEASSYDYSVGLLSPAIDGGNDAQVLPIYLQDVEGNPRIHGEAVDLGAYESPYCPLDVDIEADGPLSFCTGENMILSASAGEQFLWSGGSTNASLTVSQAGTHSLVAADDQGCRGSASVQVSLLTATAQINGLTYFCEGETTLLTAAGNHPQYLWDTGVSGNSITVSEAGPYTVDIVAANGCTASATVTVTERANPVPSVSFNGTVLSTSNASDYQWSLNGEAISQATSMTYAPQENGVYTVTVIDGFGCTGTSADFSLQNLSIEGDPSSIQMTLFPNPVQDAFMMRTAMGNWDYRLVDALGRICLSGTYSGTEHRQSLHHLSKGIYTIHVSGDGGNASLRLVKE